MSPWSIRAVTLAVLVTALGMLARFHPSLSGQPGTVISGGALLELTGPTMGTGYRVLVHTDDLAPAPRAALAQDISATLTYLDRTLLSTYAPDSQLSRLNAQPAGMPLLVASELLAVLDTAVAVHGMSGGAFDITVKPLVDLWGFGPLETRQSPPPQAAIDDALQATGMDKLVLDHGAGTVTRFARVTLDLSAIAKGYAVDELAKVLEAGGIEDYLVEIGGEIRIRGARPGGEPWQVGIETPEHRQATLYQALQTGNRPLAIAASGNYRNFFVYDGIRYSHTIDPLTGRPVSHNLASVTVIAESAMLADAWATALAVLGPEAGMTLANELQLAAYFIVDGSNGFSAFHSEAFNRYL